ncbi:transglutaminase-like domain-containing protein [Labedella endophytica]|uniref:DUF4129 domain-containing protein n=1 Tax=Labedella endophytica TaxID=1523160 RepID=A0A3S0VRZ8_9MICO|nr:transglutaminase-like domain-containing protein [Labedella endophytica]RUQ98869.1 DUF4129 domain-containing protein [Labedella endophytica]
MAASRGLPGRRYVVWTLVASTAAVAVAAAAMWPIYESAAFVRAGIGALLVGQLIAVVGARRRFGAWSLALLSLLVLAVIGVPLAVPTQAIGGVLPSAGGLGSLAEGSLLSWKRLLTIATPVGDYQALLVPALLLVLAATVTTTSIALRARVPDLATVVPVLLLVAGIVLGPERPVLPVATAVALAAVLLAWLTALRERRAVSRLAEIDGSGGSLAPSRGDRRRGAVSSAVSALAVIAVATGAGAGAAMLVPPASDRALARNAVERPFDPRDYPSPLSTFRAYHSPQQADAVILTADGLDASRIRLAVMDDFDGVVWRVGTAANPSDSGSFERLPFRLEPTVAGDVSLTEVTIGSYDGVWLPGTGYLGSVDFAGDRPAALSDSLYYNANAGTSAVTEGLRSGDAYTIDAVEPAAAGIDEIGELVPARTPTRPGDSPDGLLDFLDRFTTPGATPGEDLEAVLAGLGSVGYISHGVGEDEPRSPSGHGLDRLSALLSDTPMVGDGEQYASFAALAARQLGFPSRVVMGFSLDEDLEEATSGPVAFTGSDVAAWIEIEVAGRGWVAVDPTPEDRPVPEVETEDPSLIARPYPDLQPEVEEEPDRSEQTAPDSSEPEEEPVIDPFLAALVQIARVLSWLVIVLALALSPFIAVIAAKARRRSLRRRTTDPEERVVAGWREFRDAVIDHGIEPPPASTRHEVATLHGSRGAHRLAVLADRVTYSTLPSTDEDADRAWRLVDDLRRALGSRVDRRGRLLALVSLRSLGLRRGRSTPARNAPRRPGTRTEGDG